MTKESGRTYTDENGLIDEAETAVSVSRSAISVMFWKRPPCVFDVKPDGLAYRHPSPETPKDARPTSGEIKRARHIANEIRASR